MNEEIRVLVIYFTNIVKNGNFRLIVLEILFEKKKYRIPNC